MQRNHKPNCKKNYKKGPRRKVFQLVMMCGCIPYQGIALLNGNFYTITRKIDEMKKEGILEKRKLQTEWIIGFNEYSHEIKDISEENFSKDLRNHFEETGLEYWNRARYKDTDLYRIVRMAETVMFMDDVEIDYMVGEKSMLDDTDNNSNVYYSPSELNRIGGSNAKIRGSRETGVLFTDGGNYVIYNVSKWFPRVKSGYEYRFRQFVNKLLVMKDMEKIDGALFMYENEQVLMKYLCPNDQSQKETVKNLEEAYDNIYSVPYSKQGQGLVKMMKQKYWKELLIQIVYEHLKANSDLVFLRDTRNGVNNDGYDLTRDIELLVMLVPNIKKFRTFVKRAMMQGDPRRYLIVCYEYEKRIIEEAVQGMCMVKALTFDSVESVFNYRRNK